MTEPSDSGKATAPSAQNTGRKRSGKRGDRASAKGTNSSRAKEPCEVAAEKEKQAPTATHPPPPPQPPVAVADSVAEGLAPRSDADEEMDASADQLSNLGASKTPRAQRGVRGGARVRKSSASRASSLQQQRQQQQQQQQGVGEGTSGDPGADDAVDGGAQVQRSSVVVTASGKKEDNAVTARLKKTKMCYFFFEKGKCASSNCCFAHSPEELRVLPNLHKTKLCKAWAQDGICPDGANCAFAHGEAELRVTDGIYKTQMCHFYERGRCLKGDRCNHAHGVHDMRQPVTLGGRGPALESLANQTPSTPGRMARPQHSDAAAVAPAEGGDSIGCHVEQGSTGGSPLATKGRTPLSPLPEPLPLAELLSDSIRSPPPKAADAWDPYSVAGLPSNTGSPVDGTPGDPAAAAAAAAAVAAGILVPPLPVAHHPIWSVPWTPPHGSPYAMLQSPMTAYALSPSPGGADYAANYSGCCGGVCATAQQHQYSSGCLVGPGMEEMAAWSADGSAAIMDTGGNLPCEAQGFGGLAPLALEQRLASLDTELIALTSDMRHLTASATPTSEQGGGEGTEQRGPRRVHRI